MRFILFSFITLSQFNLFPLLIMLHFQFLFSIFLLQLDLVYFFLCCFCVSFQNHLTHYSNLDQNLPQLAKPGDFFNLSPVGTVSSCKLRSWFFCWWLYWVNLCNKISNCENNPPEKIILLIKTVTNILSVIKRYCFFNTLFKLLGWKNNLFF